MNDAATEMSELERVIANLDVGKEEEDRNHNTMEDEESARMEDGNSIAMEDVSSFSQTQTPTLPIPRPGEETRHEKINEQHHTHSTPPAPSTSQSTFRKVADEEEEEEFNIPSIRVAKQRLIKAKKKRLLTNARECVKDILDGLTFDKKTRPFGNYDKATIMRVSRAFRKLGYKTKPFCTDPEVDSWSLSVSIEEPLDECAYVYI